MGRGAGWRDQTSALTLLPNLRKESAGHKLGRPLNSSTHAVTEAIQPTRRLALAQRVRWPSRGAARYAGTLSCCDGWWIRPSAACSPVKRLHSALVLDVVVESGNPAEGARPATLVRVW